MLNTASLYHGWYTAVGLVGQFLLSLTLAAFSFTASPLLVGFHNSSGQTFLQLCSLLVCACMLYELLAKLWGTATCIWLMELCVYCWTVSAVESLIRSGPHSCDNCSAVDKKYIYLQAGSRFLKGFEKSKKQCYINFKWWVLLVFSKIWSFCDWRNQKIVWIVSDSQQLDL